MKAKITYTFLLVYSLAYGAQQKEPFTILVRHRATILDLMPQTYKIAKDVWHNAIFPYLDNYALPKKLWAKSFNKSIIKEGVIENISKNILTQDEINQLGFKQLQNDQISFAQYSPNHKYIYIVYGNRPGERNRYEVQIWNTETKQKDFSERVFLSLDEIKKVEFSTDNRKFMLMDSKYPFVYVYTFISTEKKSIFNSNEKTFEEIVNAHFALGSQLIVTLSPDGIVRIYDLADNKLLHQLPGKISVNNPFVISQDGTQIISQESENTQRIWQSSFNTLTLEQRVFIWLVDEYYHKLLRYNPGQRNKVLELIAHLYPIDITELARVLSTFSPENQKIIREVYDFDLTDEQIQGMQNCCIIC